MIFKVENHHHRSLMTISLNSLRRELHLCVESNSCFFGGLFLSEGLIEYWIPHQFHQFSLKGQTRHQLKWNTARECWYWIKTQTGVFDKGSVYMVSFETAPLTTEMNEKEGTCFRLRPLKIPAVTRLGFYTGNWWYFKLYWKLFFFTCLSFNQSQSLIHPFIQCHTNVWPSHYRTTWDKIFFFKK